MDTYQGKCRFCGNEQPIMAESQEDADEIVSGSCGCGAASFEQKKAKLMERIAYIAKGDYAPQFAHLTEKTVRMLRAGGVDVMSGNADSITYSLADSKVRIWTDGDKYKVSRTGTQKEVAEA